MPYKTEWVEPDVFHMYIHPVTKAETVVYHAYKDNDADEVLSYWYALYTGEEDFDEGIEFDVRELPHYRVEDEPRYDPNHVGEYFRAEREYHKKVIEQSIELNLGPFVTENS
jgi:hypothetical protein